MKCKDCKHWRMKSVWETGICIIKSDWVSVTKRHPNDSSCELFVKKME